jgi:hypothetical protein
MEEQNFVSLGGSKDVQPTIYLSTRNRKWIAISGIFSIFQLVIGIIFLVSFDFLKKFSDHKFNLDCSQRDLLHHKTVDLHHFLYGLVFIFNWYVGWSSFYCFWNFL